MYNKFAERYLCAVYRMRRLNISIGIDSSCCIGGVYARGKENRLDPLAFMLEGSTFTGRGCYTDFAKEHSIPIDALAMFRQYLVGNEISRSAWASDNPVKTRELLNLGYGIFYYIRERYQDSRYYLDMVTELDRKLKMRQIITNPKVVKAYRQDEYTNQLW